MKSTQDIAKSPDIEEIHKTFKQLEDRLFRMRVILSELKKQARVKSKMEQELADALNPLD